VGVGVGAAARRIGEPARRRARAPPQMLSALVPLLLAAIAAVAPREVLVVYYSASNHTRLLAEAIGRGAGEATGTNVRVQPTNRTSQLDLLRADAVVIGSPVYFGSQAAAMSSWIEQTWTPMWQTGNLSGKLGAAFATGGGLAQGLEHVLAELVRRLVHFKMHVVYPDQTFGSGYHSYGAIAVTATEPWSDGGGPASVAKVFLDAGTDLGRTVASRLAEGRRGETPRESGCAHQTQAQS